MNYIFKSLKLLIKKYPHTITNNIILAIVESIKTLIPIYLIGQVITLYENGAKPMEMVIIVVISAIVFLIANIITDICNYFTVYIERNFMAGLSILFYNKLNQLDYDFHESPNFLNDYTRALETGTTRIYQTAMGVINITRILIQSLSVFTIIFLMHYLAVVYALMIGIIYMVIRVMIGKLDFKALSIQRPFFRERNYINRTFYSKDAIPDLKTSDIEALLLDRNFKANNNIIKVIDTVTIKKASLSYIGDILISSIYPVALGILAYVSIESINISQFASLTIAATSLSSLISRFVTTMADLQNNSVECKIPFEVLNKQGEIEGVDYVKEEFKSIKVENASFSYGGEDFTLKNINMEINKGEKIAVVGSNGAGKTTIVKLLLRLYDTSNGDIYFNDQNYKELNTQSLRKHVGAVFQNVEVYAATIAENIIFREPKTEEDFILIEEALRFSGLYDYVMNLEDGIHTEITREFNRTGAIFSGGQKQRLAIARGYAQNYELLILDEPSSALDPLAEAQVYHNMLELGKTKTIVFISHRLTTTINADRIYLFENGEIIEAGNHSELMELDGVYKQMFSSQASKYLGGEYENY